MNKHRAGRNTRWFTPEGLRELGPSEKVGMEPMAYVKLEGLGKIPFSNIRRPRPLMDLEAKQPASDEVWPRIFTTPSLHTTRAHFM